MLSFWRSPSSPVIFSWTKIQLVKVICLSSSNISFSSCLFFSLVRFSLYALALKFNLMSFKRHFQYFTCNATSFSFILLTKLPPFPARILLNLFPLWIFWLPWLCTDVESTSVLITVAEWLTDSSAETPWRVASPWSFLAGCSGIRVWKFALGMVLP